MLEKHRSDDFGDDILLVGVSNPILQYSSPILFWSGDVRGCTSFLQGIMGVLSVWDGHGKPSPNDHPQMAHHGWDFILATPMTQPVFPHVFFPVFGNVLVVS